MDAQRSSIDEVVETTSAEQASQLGKQGWVMLAIGKGRDANGEACLKYSLGWKQPREPGADLPPSSLSINPGQPLL